MSRARWLQFGVVLVVAFLVSVAAGAWVGRQRIGTPVATVPTPSPAPTELLTASPLPTLPHTPTAAPPGTTPSAALVLDPPSPEEFAGELLTAFQSGDTQSLFDRVHPLVLERYGEGQCRRHVNRFGADPLASWTVQSSSGPAPWEWETDDLTTTVSDAWTVTTEIPGVGQREMHFASSNGTWRWFVDCGEPR